MKIKASFLYSIAATLFLFVAFSVNMAKATTFAIFGKDGQKASIMVNGRPGDADAIRIFDLLSAEPQEIQGKITKRTSFTGTDGVKCFDVICAFSKLIPENGSCFVVLQPAAGVTIDAGRKLARYELSDDSAREFAKLFAAGSRASYASSDGKLTFELTENNARVEYQ